MENWIYSAIGGGVLLVSGLCMMRAHHRRWQERQTDPELSDNDRWHFRHQYRRRMQASGMFVVLGLLIPLVDFDPLFRRHPLLWTALVIVILALTLWLAVLAVGDLLSTSAHSRVALGRIREQQRQLERQVSEIRARTSNGHGEG